MKEKSKDTSFAQLVKRVNKDNPTSEDRAELRKVLERRSSVLWGEVGTAAYVAMETTLGLMRNGVGEELTRQAMETMKKELGYDQSPAIERLLIDNVLLSWMVHDVTMWHYVESRKSTGTTFTQAKFYEQRMTTAQRRYLRAVETLARVRKMRLPPLQINVGGVQTITTNVSPTGKEMDNESRD